MRKLINIITYPVCLVLFSFIEYDLWKAYKKAGYNVPNYFRFFWFRMYGTLEDNDYKQLTSLNHTKP